MVRFNKQMYGFSLTEFAIVIIVIGLVLAGVASGQKLIKQAELRRMAADIAKVESSMNTFFLDFKQYPGDYSGAYTIWGSSCSNTGSNDSDKCNGDGNGLVSPWSTEGRMFWKHMNLAGMYDGKFSGAVSPDDIEDTPGVDVPRGVFEGSGMHITGTDLIIGKERTNDRTCTAILKPVEMYLIDNKLDDGMPRTGKYRSDYAYLSKTGGVWTYTNCISNLTSSATYLTSSTVVACSLVYKLSYQP
jgi:type II secretory pathway pseudopilin PulG